MRTLICLLLLVVAPLMAQVEYAEVENPEMLSIRKGITTGAFHLEYVGPIAGVVAIRDGATEMVLWPDLYGTRAACDSDAECKKKVDELCKKHGHGGAKNSDITDQGGGTKICMGGCAEHGAVAFTICKPTIVIDPPPMLRGPREIRPR